MWAVGLQENSLNGLGSEQPLIEHWAGSSWATVPASGVASALEKVSAVSASDIWAAGEGPDGALILHYNGTSWTRTPTPHDNDGTVLDAVDARTASDAWAGGDDGSGHALLMHWDGTSWATVSLPAAATPDSSEILSVSADSATDVWAVSQINGGGTSALLHWDGTHWQSFTQSVIQGNVVPIESITALSPASAWAVGFQGGGYWQTLTEHWDGTRWNVVPSPNPGGTGQNNELSAVTATSDSDVWAAGSARDPFALHWNGSSWTVVSVPVSGVRVVPGTLSVSAAAPGQVWISNSDEFVTLGGEVPFAEPIPVVPDVSGDTVAAATSALTAAGLTVSSTQNSTATCTPSIPNHVASTDPAAGQQASFGQTVTLTVCGAVVINPTVTVPDVTGEDDASARSDITAAGLTVGTITLKADCTVPRGTVLSQSPAGGTTAPFGARVNLTEATRSGAAAHQITPHACTQ